MTELLPLAILQRMWPHGDQRVPDLIEGIAASAPAVFAKYGIATPLVIAHLMGQFSEECAAGLELVENLNYSATGLLRTWPAHFSPRTAELYAHNQRMIANMAYGGRMGNAPVPSDDGWNFRGRGLSQTTGRDAYRRLSEAVGFDLVGNPNLVNDPAHALECGVCDFVLCGCLPFAERDDVVDVTKHLNGGLIGLSQRRAWVGRWKAVLGAGQ